MVKLTRFERARLISARALQLSLGAPPLIKSSPDESSYDLAKRELDEKVLPMSVLRVFPSGEIVKVEIA